MRITTKVSVLTASLVIALTAGVPVFAHEEAFDDTPTVTTASETTDSTDTSTTSKVNTRLAEAKLKVCQNRQHVIDTIMTNAASRGQRQLDLFTTIAERTEAFYTNKGKTLSNYDDLVAAVKAKQTAAQSAVDAVKTDSTGFSCDGSDPKGAVTAFKSAWKAEIAALQDYRTAIKNLIVGVKSVQGTTSSSTGGEQ